MYHTSTEQKSSLFFGPHGGLLMHLPATAPTTCRRKFLGLAVTGAFLGQHLRPAVASPRPASVSFFSSTYHKIQSFASFWHAL